ncbi:MAG: DUF805 domain-containing protein [Magnetococcales bacterium]|nr:DUF805 domain-containing protein [Magnetococcales bacterium]
MRVIELYVEVLKKFGDFRGRASRRQYFIFFYISLIVILSSFMGDAFLKMWGIAFFGFLYIIITALPFLSLSVRRMHDAGKPGWPLALIIAITTAVVSIASLAVRVEDGVGLNAGNEFANGFLILCSLIIDGCLFIIYIIIMSLSSNIKGDQYGQKPVD